MDKTICLRQWKTLNEQQPVRKAIKCSSGG